MLYFSKSFRSLRAPIVPAQIPTSSQNFIVDRGLSGQNQDTSTDVTCAVFAPV